MVVRVQYIVLSCFVCFLKFSIESQPIPILALCPHSLWFLLLFRNMQHFLHLSPSVHSHSVLFCVSLPLPLSLECPPPF